MLTYSHALEEFKKVCKEEKHNDEDIKLFLKTITYANKILEGKNRIGGYPLIVHDINTASWIVKSGLCKDTVLCALLYDSYKFISHEEIEQKFGKDVSNMLKETKKLSEMTKKKKEQDNENLNRMILVSLKDLRVLFVKIATKLENVINIKYLPIKEQQRIAKYILNFYAPLANRLGLAVLRRNLEEYSFRIVNASKYTEIKNYLKESEEEQENFLNGLIYEMKTKISSHVELKNIFGRIKSIYSIYSKFQRNSNQVQQGKKSLKQQWDIYGIRIIVNTIGECYKVRDLIFKEFKVFRELTKDYIANTKPNGYESIHVFLEHKNKRVEIQIRTQEMDFFAEKGSAAHSSYKGFNPNLTFEKRISWLRDLFEVQQDSTSNEFLKKTSFELFNERIFCFTPHNDVIKLDKDSCVWDFAFALHNKIGLHCVGAMIDGVFCVGEHKLENGTTVEIITHKDQKPSKSWLDYCKTKKARISVKDYLTKFGNVKKEELEILLPIERNYVDFIQPTKKTKEHYRYTIAKCCNPLPLDHLQGNIRDDLIYVHKKDCDKLKAYDKFISLEWMEKTPKEFFLIVNARNRKGLLMDLLSTMKNKDLSIIKVKATSINDENAKTIIKLNSSQLKVVSGVVKKLEKIEGVTSVKIEGIKS